MEATEQKIVMANENPSVIQRFQLWVFTGSVLVDGESEMTLTSGLLVRVYIFAESQGISLLQDHIIDVLAAKHKKFESPFILHTDINLIYENTAENSPLRDFLVRMFVHDFKAPDRGFLKDHEDEFPKAFLIDLTFAYGSLSNINSLRVSPITTPCKFHVHPPPT